MTPQNQTFRDKSWWSPANFGIGLACVLVSHGAGLIGLLFTSAPGTWYRSLTKPPATPPGYVFGIVWPILYTLVGVALFVFVRQASRTALTEGLLVFGVQWGLNALWTPMFFGWHKPTLALVTIVFLLIAISWTMMLFYKQSRWAAALLFPYFAWCAWAAYLNAGFIWLNG